MKKIVSLKFVEALNPQTQELTVKLVGLVTDTETGADALVDVLASSDGKLEGVTVAKAKVLSKGVAPKVWLNSLVSERGKLQLGQTRPNEDGLVRDYIKMDQRTTVEVESWDAFDGEEMGMETPGMELQDPNPAKPKK